MLVTVDLIGADEVRELFDTVHDNMLDESETGEEIFDALERGYERQWKAWHGYMVETGATREAWTNPNAPGAIRELAGFETFHFGSSIQYNQYHARTLIEPADKMTEAIADALADYYVPVVPAFRPGKRIVKPRLRLPGVLGKPVSKPPQPNVSKPRIKLKPKVIRRHP